MRRPRTTRTSTYLYFAVFFLSFLFSPETTLQVAAHGSNGGDKRLSLLFGGSDTQKIKWGFLRKRLAPWKQQLKNQPRDNSSLLAKSGSHPPNSSLTTRQEDDIFQKNDINNEFSEDEQSEDSSSRSMTATVLAALQGMVQNPRFQRIAANSIQLGLIMYLAHAVWQSAAEVIDEYSKEMKSSNSAFCSRDQVERLVEFLEQDPAVVHASLRDMTTTGKIAKTFGGNRDVPSLQILGLARKLLLAGMPLRQEEGDENAENSVESVLLSVTKTEAGILQQCLWTPSFGSHDDTAVREAWNSVTGLQGVKTRLLDSVAGIRATAAASSSQSPHSYSSLFEDAGGSGGILLYGPPGCGKTMLIKALAGTTRVPCLIITPSALLRQYVGETNLRVRSLFSLTKKLAPCVLCIDELDGLFRERNADEHEVFRDLKTEFLQWWDGMLGSTSGGKRVLVVGATNRPFDVDSAVLRRLPQSFYIDLPDLSARRALLTKLVGKIPTEPDLDIANIASRTGGYSPSDLRQLLQTAAMTGPLREANLQSSSSHRPLSNSDINRALDMVRPTPRSHDYRTALGKFAGSLIQPDDTGRLSPYETDWGNFYDAGTLELDNETFDLLTDIANEMDTLSDDRDNDDSDFDL